MIFDGRKKLAWQQKSLLRMQPSDQGLRTQHLTGAHIDLRLVVNGKFAIRQTQADALDHSLTFVARKVVRSIKDEKAVFSGCFRFIHRLIGLP